MRDMGKYVLVAVVAGAIGASIPQIIRPAAAVVAQPDLYELHRITTSLVSMQADLSCLRIRASGRPC